jgi:filamentous hemagglutinin
VPGVGSSDIDVLGPAGEIIAVGGPAKAKDLSRLGQQLKIQKCYADAKGVRAIAYFEEGTPDSVINLAKKHLGAENVKIFPAAPY